MDYCGIFHNADNNFSSMSYLLGETMASQHSNSKHQDNRKQIWQDKCRVCLVDERLVALPYIEASRVSDYELGATLAAISGNRLIRRLISSTAIDN